jgi:carbon-monoxide dehydrogenase medium subunit
LIREKLSILAQAAAEIGDAQVRNRGTIGGGLAEADPVGDYGPIALALDARMKCVRPSGVREIPATEFFTFAYTTALEPDEILMEIIFPLPPHGSAGVYHKLEKVAGDFAIAAAAVQLAVDKSGACSAIGIGVSGCGTVPQKAVAAENLLRGKRIASELIDQAARMVQQDAEPIEDLRGSAAYKKKVLGVVVRRAIAEALALQNK